MKPRVVFYGVVNLYTGYGRHSIKIIESLEAAGFDVVVRPLEVAEQTSSQKLPIPVKISRNFVGKPQQDEWEILLSPPKHRPTPGKKVIYYTMWESTRLSANAVALLNLAEVVLVPCKWNRQGFIESGVKKPIFVVPLGIDLNVFRPSPIPISNKTIFGCAGRLAHGDSRKGLRDVIKAFKIAFPKTRKDVELWVKGFADCPVGELGDKRIISTEKYFSDHEYVRWLSGLTAFVSAAKSEGWGWHQQEAMAIGRPLIACRYGGVAEFYDASCGPEIAFKEVPAQEIWKGLGNWAQPDVKTIAIAMKWVAANRNKTVLDDMGAAASRHARAFSDAFAAERLVNVMRDVGMIR